MHPRLQNAPTGAPTAHPCTYGRTHDAPICTYGCTHGTHRINSYALRNEKYKGDARLQKKFTVDFLQKKMKVNEGEVPQYYVENSHEAIIDPLLFDRVQEELARRKALGRSYSGKSIFSCRLICGDCGHYLGSKVWNSTTAIDQEEYTARYSGLVERYDRAQARINDLEKQRTERMAKADAIGGFTFRLRELDQPLEHFDERLWLDVIDIVTVYHNGDLTFKFQNGREIMVSTVQ